MILVKRYEKIKIFEMKTIIKSTSYIIPHQEIIKKISIKGRVDFSKFGEIFGRQEKEYNNEILVIFFQDLVDINSDNQKKEILKVKIFLKNIETKIKNKSKNFVLLFSTFNHINVINNAKEINLYDQLANQVFKKFHQISKKVSNFYFINLDQVFGADGYKNIFDNRNFYLARCRLSMYGIEILFKNINLVLERIYFTNKKVLLLDCDNTLWGGVLGEDGIQNIVLGTDGIGQAYVDFQKNIKYLKKKEYYCVWLVKMRKVK